MRHRKRRTKLSMMTAHRNAMLKNMARAVLKHQRITTTSRRAKEVRRLVEHLIGLGKVDSVTSRRRAYSVLNDRDMVGRLFKEIAPLFKNRSSGYTRIIPLNFRRGDGANLVIFELTEKQIVEKLPKKKKEAKAKSEEQVKTAKEHKEEVKKEEPRIKTLPRTKPTLAEEKRTEKAKSEDKKMGDKKAFLKNLRGFFRRKTDM